MTQEKKKAPKRREQEAKDSKAWPSVTWFAHFVSLNFNSRNIYCISNKLKDLCKIQRWLETNSNFKDLFLKKDIEVLPWARLGRYVWLNVKQSFITL